MYQTRKMMEKLITPQSRTMKLNELAKLYQEKDKDEKPIKNPVYLATAFYQLYNLIIKIRVDNYCLNEQDVVSITLERLDKCLLKFDGSGKFATFFANCLYRKLKDISKLARNKQRRLEDSVEDASLYENVYHDYEQHLYDLNQNLSSLNLTIQEQMYIGLLMQGYNKVEIANLFQISKKNLYTQLEKLKTQSLHDMLTV